MTGHYLNIRLRIENGVLGLRAKSSFVWYGNSKITVNMDNTGLRMFFPKPQDKPVLASSCWVSPWFGKIFFPAQYSMYYTPPPPKAKNFYFWVSIEPKTFLKRRFGSRENIFYVFCTLKAAFRHILHKTESFSRNFEFYSLIFSLPPPPPPHPPFQKPCRNP